MIVFFETLAMVESVKESLKTNHRYENIEDFAIKNAVENPQS